MKKVTLELTENEALTLVYALSNQKEKYLQHYRNAVYFDSLSEKIADQVVEQSK